MSPVPFEQVLVFTLMLIFATIHGLVRWRRGVVNSRLENRLAASEWETEERALDPLDPVEIEPPRIVEMKTSARFEPQQRQPLVAPRRLPRFPSRPGTLPAQAQPIHAGRRDMRLIPENAAELRRAIALVAIFGPPRALDPPK